jgi:uncharacterized protein (TIGR02391 family)
MTILDDAPYQVSVQYKEFIHDREIFLLKVTATNTQDHTQVKAARFGLTDEATLVHFRHRYDKNTRGIEQLIARRFVQWSKENPGAVTPEPDELLLIKSEDIAALAGERIGKDIAEAHLAQFLLDAYRCSAVSTFDSQGLFVSTRLQRAEFDSAVEYFCGIGIIEDSSGMRQQMKLNPANHSKAETIAAKLSARPKPVKPKSGETSTFHKDLEQASRNLFEDGYFSQAVFEGCKALNERVRQETGRSEDGDSLMRKVFSANEPLLRLNTGVSDSDKNEQTGFMNIFAGVMMGIRNPRAHELYEDRPERALAILGLLSLLFEIVDEAAARNSTTSTTSSP